MNNQAPVIEGARGVLVKAGLGTPLARGFVVGVLVGGVAYGLGVPKQCFDEDGQMRPLKGLSKAPTATYTHFLAIPLLGASIAFVFT